MNNYDYKYLTPFKWFILENFPFIEADFDALTNWQLFCKLGKEMNKIIDSTNLTGEQVENLTNAFNELKSYVDNYFENLDVQEEINNKLDEMTEDGTLQEIITAFLEINGILSFNTILDLKNATYLNNGTSVRTLGQNSYNDGNGAFYKIRNKTNDDIIDDFNIISLNNYSNLVGERLISNDSILLNTLNNKFNEINTLKNRRIICIGDSYLTGSTNGEQYATQGWAERLISLANLQNSYFFGDGGSGFTVEGHNGFTFETLITSNLNNILNKNTITDILVCGGYNDAGQQVNSIISAIQSFINVCKTNFPNAKIYLGCIGGNSAMNTDGKQRRNYILNRSLYAFKTCNKYGAYYLNNVELILKNYSLFSNDNLHPTPEGYQTLAEGILQSWIQGDIYIQYPSVSGFVENENALIEMDNYIQINNNITTLILSGRIRTNSEISITLGTPIKLAHLNTPYLRKTFNNALYFDFGVKLGNNNLPTDSTIYIDDNNDLYVIFYSLPSGITSANNFKIYNFVEHLPSIYC